MDSYLYFIIAGAWYLTGLLPLSYELYQQNYVDLNDIVTTFLFSFLGPIVLIAWAIVSWKNSDIKHKVIWRK